MPAVRVLTPWRKVNGINEMAVAVDYPAAWSDATGQTNEDIDDGLDLLVVQGDVSEAQLTTIQADSRYPILISGNADEAPADLDDTAKAALKAELAAVVHVDLAALATDAGANPVDIADALIEATLKKPWRAGEAVAVGDVRYHSGNLYEVVQAHTTQADWTPNITYALWKRYYNPDNAPEPWRQPQGSHDAYRVGQRVTYNGATWENTSAANVFAPGVFGWTNLAPVPPTSAWAVGVAYKVNDLVTYQGSTYKCVQAHTSQVGWTPTAVPALWQLQE